MFRMLRTRPLYTLAILVCAGLLLSACTSRFATRGNLPDPERLAELVPNETHARDVAEILGTPSTFSTFGGESWYYISERVEYYAFLEPEILDRTVVQVKFTKEGVVEWVEEQDNQQSRDIAFVERTTPTAGNEITFFEQIFGNLGRFNKE